MEINHYLLYNMENYSEQKKYVSLNIYILKKLKSFSTKTSHNML